MKLDIYYFRSSILTFQFWILDVGNKNLKTRTWKQELGVKEIKSLRLLKKIFLIQDRIEIKNKVKGPKESK